MQCGDLWRVKALFGGVSCVQPPARKPRWKREKHLQHDPEKEQTEGSGGCLPAGKGLETVSKGTASCLSPTALEGKKKIWHCVKPKPPGREAALTSYTEHPKAAANGTRAWVRRGQSDLRATHTRGAPEQQMHQSPEPPEDDATACWHPDISHSSTKARGGPGGALCPAQQTLQTPHQSFCC